MGKHIFSCVWADPVLNQLSALTINRHTIYSSQSQHFYGKRRRISFSGKSPCAFDCSPGNSATREATAVNSHFQLCKDTWTEIETVVTGRQEWHPEVLHLKAITPNQSHMEVKWVSLWDQRTTQDPQESAHLSLGLLFGQPTHDSSHHVPEAWGAAEWNSEISKG